MSEQSSLKEFLAPAKWVITTCILSFVLCIVFVFLSFSQTEEGEASPLTDFSSENEYCYLDVIGVSDWVLTYDGETYYSAITDSGYWFTVILTDNQFADMSTQYEYFQSDEDIPSETYRLYGVSQKAWDEMVTEISNVWQLSEDEYYGYFGPMYLDATTTPAEQISGVYFSGALLSFFFFFIFTLSLSVYYAKRNKLIKRLTSLDLIEQANMELNNPLNTVFEKNKLILSENFLFCGTTGTVIKYTDIAWCYIRTQRINFIPYSESIIVNTFKLGSFNLVNSPKVGKNNDMFNAVFEKTAQSNPNVLIGYSKQNSTAFRQAKKDAKHIL